jgi:Leucine-rich repeat (LRR) protein
MGLTEVYLQNNNLTSLPESFRNLDSLVHIRVDHTYLSEFPSQLYGLNNIKSISFIDTNISVLPVDILEFERLEQLAFREARIDFYDSRNDNYDFIIETLHERGVKVFIIDYE